jgi:hypothetical protein
VEKKGWEIMTYNFQLMPYRIFLAFSSKLLVGKSFSTLRCCTDFEKILNVDSAV